ncbi:putative endopeptidase p60 precursor [compost metagenome]
MKDSKVKQAKVTAAYLNVRAGASSQAKIVTAVPKGTILEVISTEKYGWLKVKLDGRVVYVYGKYVSMLK